MLSQTSQSEKATYYMIPIMLHSRKSKSTVSKKMSGSQALAGRDWISEGDFLGKENILYDTV